MFANTVQLAAVSHRINRGRVFVTGREGGGCRGNGGGWRLTVSKPDGHVVVDPFLTPSGVDFNALYVDTFKYLIRETEVLVLFLECNRSRGLS